MRGKRFSRVFYGYDRKFVDKMVAEKLQEIEVENAGTEVIEGHYQMKVMLNFLKMQLEGAKVRKTLLHRARNYTCDFPNDFKSKAHSMAQDIMQEAQNYVREKEGEVASIAKRIEEIERQLAMISKITDNMIETVPLDSLMLNVAVSRSGSAEVSQGAKIIAFPDFLALSASNDTNKHHSKEIVSIIHAVEEVVNAKKHVAAQDTEPQERPISKAISETAAVKKAVKIETLIVEDDQSVLRLLVSILEREGFAVHVAVDGHEAVQLIDTLPYVSIVLLDSMLPYKSGLQLLKYIRSKPDWTHTTVIMMADNMAEKDIIAAINNGADDSIQKPFNPRELVAKINRFVQRARSSQAQ